MKDDNFKLNTKTRYYNGWLIEEEKKRGMNSVQMAKFIGIGYASYCSVRSLRSYPNQSGYSKVLQKICSKLDLDFNKVFPEWLKEVIDNRDPSVTVYERNYEVNKLSLDRGNMFAIGPGMDEVEEEIDREILSKKIGDSLDTLDSRERKVLEMRFGLNGETIKTFEEVGKVFNVTRERIRQVEAKALRKMRHPIRKIIFTGFIGAKV